MDGRLHLLYNSDYRVLICRTCKYALSPNGVKKHLERTHKHLSLDVRKGLVGYARTLDLVTMEEVGMLRPGPKPVVGLEVVSGFYCIRCEYACATERTIMVHCRESHGWVKGIGRAWEGCQVQRFFTGGDRHYFRVESPMDDRLTVTDDLVKAMIDGKDRREREEENQLMTVRSTQDKVDLTPWMQRTGWLRMFVGRDMQSLASFSHKPSKTEPELTILWERTEAMLRRCGEGI